LPTGLRHLATSLRRRLGTVSHEFFGGRFVILEGGEPHNENAVAGASGVVYFVEVDIEEDFEPGEICVSVNVGRRYRPCGEIGDGFVMTPTGEIR
jgi:hypothetical protein